MAGEDHKKIDDSAQARRDEHRDEFWRLAASAVNHNSAAHDQAIDEWMDELD